MNRPKGQLRQLVLPGSLIFLCLGILMIHQCRTLNEALPYWPLPSWEELTTLRIDRPGLNGPERNLELEKQGETWVLSSLNRPAGKEEILPLINLINSLQPVDMLAEKGPYDRFGLDETSLITLTLQSGDRKETILAGGSSASGNYSYVRREDDPAVYSVRGNLAELLNRPVASYRNRQILSFQAAEVTSLIFFRGEKQSILVRNGEDWKRNRDELIDSKSVETDLKRMSRLKCLSFLPEEENAMPSDGLLTVLVATDQQRYKLVLLQENENSFTAGTERSPDLFLLSRFDGQFLMDLSGF
jgi:hypothetical protein